jgi:hypothetical protein
MSIYAQPSSLEVSSGDVRRHFKTTLCRRYYRMEGERYIEKETILSRDGSGTFRFARVRRVGGGRWGFDRFIVF